MRSEYVEEEQPRPRRGLQLLHANSAHMPAVKEIVGADPALKKRIKNASSMRDYISLASAINTLVPREQRGNRNFLMNEVQLLKEWIITSEQNIPASAKKVDISFNNTETQIKINDSTTKIMNMGFEIPESGKNVVRTEVTKKVIESAVSCLAVEQNNMEIAFETTKFHAPIAIKNMSVLKLGAALTQNEIKSKCAAEAEILESMDQIEVVNMIQDIAPPVSRPSFVQDNRGVGQLMTSPCRPPILSKDTYDVFFKAINGLSKKSGYTDICNGYLTGHNFGNEQKYIEFLADFKTFNIGKKIVIHTSDQQYAITLLNYDDTLDVTIKGTSVTTSGRYNTTFASRIYGIPGDHIFPDPTPLQTRARTSIFETAAEDDAISREDCSIIKGAIFRKVKVFALSEQFTFLNSASIYKMEAWEYISSDNNSENDCCDNFRSSKSDDSSDDEEDEEEDKERNATSTFTMTLKDYKQENDCGSGGDNDDEEEENYIDMAMHNKDEIRELMAMHVMHWYLYPWIRIPYRVLNADTCVDMSGCFDMRIKTQDVIGFCNGATSDATVIQFLSNLTDYAPEIRAAAAQAIEAQKAVKPSVSLRSNRTNNNNNNNNNNSNNASSSSFSVDNDLNNGSSSAPRQSGNGASGAMSFVVDDEDDDEAPINSNRNSNSNNNSDRGNNFGSKNSVMSSRSNMTSRAIAKRQAERRLNT